MILYDFLLLSLVPHSSRWPSPESWNILVEENGRQTSRREIYSYNAFSEFGAAEQKRGESDNSNITLDPHSHLHPLLQFHLRAYSVNLPYVVVDAGRRLKI